MIGDYGVLGDKGVIQIARRRKNEVGHLDDLHQHFPQRQQGDKEEQRLERIFGKELQENLLVTLRS